MALNEMLLQALNDPDSVPMSLAQIVTEEVREFRASAQYKQMMQAEEYYLNRSDVQNKTVDSSKRSNTKIEHPILKKLIEQKVNFLLSKSFSIKSENEEYAQAVSGIFDNAARKKIKSLGKGGVKFGIAWIQPYFAEDAMRFMRMPSTEIVPLWKDAEHEELDGYIRVYELIEYIGTRKTTKERAELWTAEGIRYFIRKDKISEFAVDKEFGDEATDWLVPHFTVGNKAYNFEKPPIAWLKYNEEEIPLCYFIKELIDDVNWQTSITADVLRDVAKFIFVLKNYGGENLDEFVRDLRESLAIQVAGDGGVDKLAADLNIDAVMAFLEKNRRDLFDYGAGVDTKDPELGNASGTAINFRYMDLNADCEAMAAELRDTFQQLKVFIDVYLQVTGKGDFTNDEFSVVFNSDMPVNEAEIITSIMASRGLVSDRTLLTQHPYVEDVDAELDQLKKEKEKALKEYGEGMFNDVFGSGGNSTNPDGDEE